jgi:hypothetical protein
LINICLIDRFDCSTVRIEIGERELTDKFLLDFHEKEGEICDSIHDSGVVIGRYTTGEFYFYDLNDILPYLEFVYKYRCELDPNYLGKDIEKFIAEANIPIVEYRAVMYKL